LILNGQWDKLELEIYEINDEHGKLRVVKLILNDQQDKLGGLKGQIMVIMVYIIYLRQASLGREF